MRRRPVQNRYWRACQKLRPQVNFVSGQNGSGKSAVLQGIQQVLGVKARETGRATSQAAFIKAGCAEATITITIWNEGPEAYAQDVFGPEIIIERRIGKTGSYSLRNHRGRKVGHRREDLDAVLDALQINAANPISVMTQDTTRSFMDGGSGKRDRAKYEIYMEATMLARIADANAAASSQLAAMNAEMESERDKHAALMKELKGFVERQALAVSSEELRSAARSNNVYTAWGADGSKVINKRANSTVFPPPRNQRNPRIGVDEGRAVERVMRRLKNAQVELAAAKREYESMSNELTKLRATRMAKQKALCAAKHAKRLDDGELKALLQERSMQPLAVTQTQDDNDDNSGGSELAEELATATQAVNDLRITLLDAQANADQADVAEAKAKRNFTAATERIKALEEANARAVNEQVHHEEALQAAQEKVEALENFRDNLETRLADLTAGRDRAQQVWEAHTETALKICSEEIGQEALRWVTTDIMTNKNLEEEEVTKSWLKASVLVKMLEKVQKKIMEEEAKAGGMQDELESKHRKMTKRVNISRRNLENLNAAFMLLKHGMDYRVAQYRNMDRLVEEIVNRRFNWYLNKKGHNGSVKVIRKTDPETGIEFGALEIKVLIDGSRTQGRVKDLKQLSGGERSFTTVAFSLAVGEFTGSPFRAMDEVDVFMDAVDRQVSLESLLTNALENKDLQFIFLTPLNISAVEGAKAKIRDKGLTVPDDFVRIAELRPARATNG